jgi:hypothetical protein
LEKRWPRKTQKATKGYPASSGVPNIGRIFNTENTDHTEISNDWKKRAEKFQTLERLTADGHE